MLKKSTSEALVINLILLLILALSFFSFAKAVVVKITAANFSKKYTQPTLVSGKYPWSVRSIDTQVISKHWPDVNRDSIKEQVVILKDLGVNYIAIGTPYDRLDDLKMWTDEIHAQGLNVWFRSHWARWEGDDGKPAVMLPDEYLSSTHDFILNNPELFVEGDAFTACVEAEQVGVGLGKRFLTWDDYRKFLLSEISVTSDAFEEIGLSGKVYTNWLSMNGWVVENQLNEEVVSKIGLITVDHFVGQSETIGGIESVDSVVKQTVEDLDEFYEKWKTPILLGEWGYQIHQEVTDERQAFIIKRLFEELKTKEYLVGVNYWVHMGNSAALIEDEYGTNLQPRKSASVVKSYYAPLTEDDVEY